MSQTTAEASAPVDPGGGKSHLESCHFCGEVYALPPVSDSEEVFCTWCKETLHGEEHIQHNVWVSHLFALVGCLLLIPALVVPMLSMEQIGVRTEAGLIQGVATLLDSGEVLLALLIGGFSGVLPVAKLVLMLLLTSRRFSKAHHSRRVYRFVEVTGKWGMLDVFLAAMMIFGFKFSAVFNVQPQPGLFVFCLMVVCNLVSTSFFDTRFFRGKFEVSQ